MTYLIVGTVIGAILGAVIGIAIGTSANAGDKLQTVISTQTLRVAGPPVSTTSTSDSTSTTGTDTTSTDGTDTSTVTDPTQTETAPAFDTTPTDTTSTETSVLQPNDIPPPDPYNPPADFCTTHVCGLSFNKGVGYVVQCVDGVWTMQGGQKRACRNDGGLP